MVDYNETHTVTNDSGKKAGRHLSCLSRRALLMRLSDFFMTRRIVLARRTSGLQR